LLQTKQTLSGLCTMMLGKVSLCSSHDIALHYILTS
jgi:hypothetical protein